MKAARASCRAVLHTKANEACQLALPIPKTRGHPTASRSFGQGLVDMAYMQRNGANNDLNSPGGNEHWTHAADAKPTRKRDWKRTVLVIGLGLLSWVATYVGLLELIEANMGDLPLLHKAIIGFSVAMLMVMVVWLLDQIFSDIGWTTRLIYVGGYVFLTLISVGFGFGFYWKVLESRGESSRSAEAAVGQVQNALHAAVTRLEQLQATLDTLTTVSTEKAQLERAQGTSCPNSRPGDGPRRQLRDDDASRFKFASDFVKGRVGVIKTELSRMNGDITKVVSADQATVSAASGTRNEFMRGLNRQLDMTVTGFNAFRSDPQLRQVRADLADRADRTSFPDTRGGTFSCPDAQLATALKGVVRAIDELPIVDKPKIAAVEGSEAVVEAFRRLGASAYGVLALKLPPSPEELRDLQKKAVQSVESTSQSQAAAGTRMDGSGLSRRDYIPLAIAVFVDLCLLLVSIKRPESPLDRLVPKMRNAEQGPVIQILSRFNEIHRDAEIRENFEVFRHVVFDYHGDYYAAVPLNTPYRPNPHNDRQRQGYGVSDAEQLMQEAHLLSNLFASFEQERIFSRVMNPLLSTAVIQKRLRRQGSKFANAGAFRVYRFRDGAWSEIILGAVMGAAKRVEDDKRRRHTLGPQDHAATAPRRTEPSFREPRHDDADPSRDANGAAMRSQPLGRAGRHQSPLDDRREADAFTVYDSAARPASDQRSTRPSATRPQPRSAFTPHVIAGGEAEEPSAPASEHLAAVVEAAGERNGTDAAGRHGPTAASPTATENVVILQAPPRQAQASEPPPLRDTAPNETIPTPTGRNEIERPEAEPRFAAAHSPARAPQAVVTVAATREQITYSLPTNDPRLPHAIWSLSQENRPELSATDVEAATLPEPEMRPDPALPPPLPSTAPVAAAAPEVVPPADPREPANEDTLDEILDLARRFGPSTREA